MKNLERKTPNYELKINQIKPEDVKFNMDSYRNLWDSLGVDFEELSKIDPKKESRELNPEILKLDEKFETLRKKAEELEKKYENLLWDDVFDDQNITSWPTAVLAGVDALWVRDKDTGNLYNVIFGYDEYIAKLGVCKDPAWFGDIPDDYPQDDEWYPVGALNYYLLDVDNYEKILNKIEEILKKEEADIEKLEKQHKENLSNMIDNL